MIQNETVLVLGAGASMPYGYPSGYGLRQKLINPKLFAHLVAKNTINSDFPQIFCQSFRLSGMKSIDAFLARRGKDLLPDQKTSLGDLGKYGIALALRQGKSFDTLFHCDSTSKNLVDVDTSDNWYEYLWAQLSQGIKKDNINDFLKTRLTLVTFNYDLSLQHYLFTAMRNTYGINADEISRLLKPINFYHMYGKLAGNPYSNTFKYDFDVTYDWRLLNEDIESIKVIDEQRAIEAVDLFDAQESLRHAKRICFLGFGFDETNILRLDIAKILSHRAYANFQSSNGHLAFPWIASTSLGMESAERLSKERLLTSELRSNGKLHNSDLHLGQIADAFNNYTTCKSELVLRRSQILV
jgi:hypothetical protein